MIGTAQSKRSSLPRWPTPLSALTPPPNPAKSSFFRRAHLPSTCLRVTPIAAISSALSSKPSLNEKEVQNAKPAQIQTQKTPRHRRAPAPSHFRERGGLRRYGRAEHEIIARIADRAPAPRRRGRRNHRIQCH